MSMVERGYCEVTQRFTCGEGEIFLWVHVTHLGRLHVCTTTITIRGGGCVHKSSSSCNGHTLIISEAKRGDLAKKPSHTEWEFNQGKFHVESSYNGEAWSSSVACSLTTACL